MRRERVLSAGGRCFRAGGWMVVLIGLSAGCGGPRFPNGEAHWPDGMPAETRYEFESLALNAGNTDELFVCLTFSGGGTRAAALAYGVLQELDATILPPVADGARRTLLDEVDIVSSVSGGSFTALALKYWGKDLFSSPFEKRFLYHNVTNDLIARVITQNLFILPLIFPDRIHIAADYVNDEIFDHASYGDFKHERPFVVVNATSMAGRRFEFTQPDFDLLGSDLNSVPLGHSAMASSAYPLLLSPLRLRYYANGLSSHALDSVFREAQANPRASRRMQWAREIVVEDSVPCVLDIAQHQFVYLLDGGVYDNLGLDHVIASLKSGPIRRRLNSAKPNRRIRDLVVIVVDAANGLPEDIEQREIAPGLFEMASRSAAIGVASHSRTILDLTHCMLKQAAGNCHVHLIDIKLDDVADRKRREWLLQLPTSLDLSNEAVDELIQAGRDLLRNHSVFNKLQNQAKDGFTRAGRAG